MMRDIDTSDEEIALHLTEDQKASHSFVPQVTVNTNLVDDEGLEADVACPPSVSRTRSAANGAIAERSRMAGMA